MKLLVTGASGQIGWELVRSLMPLGEVRAPERSRCDFSRPQTLAPLVAAFSPHVIVNAAAYTAVDRAETEEALATRINGEAVGVLAGAAKRCGALLVHYSTDYVFDGSKSTPYVEDDRVAPLNAYGRSKLAGEAAAEASGCDYLVLRTAWVFAARGGNFLRTMLRLGAERDVLRVVADQVGAPTWARNVADATAHIIARAQGERAEDRFRSGVFHLASHGATSWHGFAEAIFAEARRVTPQAVKVTRVEPISAADYPAAAARPHNSRLALDRVHARFGIAMPGWRDALARCMEDIAAR